MCVSVRLASILSPPKKEGKRKAEEEKNVSVCVRELLLGVCYTAAVKGALVKTEWQVEGEPSVLRTIRRSS